MHTPLWQFAPPGSCWPERSADTRISLQAAKKEIHHLGNLMLAYRERYHLRLTTGVVTRRYPARLVCGRCPKGRQSRTLHVTDASGKHRKENLYACTTFRFLLYSPSTGCHYRQVNCPVAHFVPDGCLTNEILALDSAHPRTLLSVHWGPLLMLKKMCAVLLCA